MNCPVCKEPMMVLEHASVEVDYCVECGGIWLDAGELDLLLGSRQITETILHAGDKTTVKKEKPRRCPICRIKMEKHTTGGSSPVMYDRCGQGHGLWFDKGELAQVLEQGGSTPEREQVVSWLREMFLQPQSG
ncbi:MAG TPA: zf-TFIIB domain-containing protein [Candidatus Hydrogenedentes bacterium]|nr:zf-TFIIB domain-containing protein [Candidatus Hydrogenedentota bacterium]